MISAENIWRLESSVKSNYPRHFPIVFSKAKDHNLWDESGNKYLDFFSGAGALNYGHNNDNFKQALISYIQRDGISHSLDFYSDTKYEFIQAFQKTILEPRRLEYKYQFVGPTGANAVEAAIKLAKKATGRQSIMSFTRSFHGMSAGAMMAGSVNHREKNYNPTLNVNRVPFDGYMGESVNTLDYIAKLLNDCRSGVDIPAAFLLETVQAEGGINKASNEWLKGLESIAKSHGILIIVDDIQAGCGRTGTFFSFEGSKILPDIICLSKSLSGYGLPLSLVLHLEEIDCWEPGEHNGTFRGNNLAFVTAIEALKYWEGSKFEAAIARKSELMTNGIDEILCRFPQLNWKLKKAGMMLGIECESSEQANNMLLNLKRNLLIAETCGPRENILKIMPSLLTPDKCLYDGLEIIDRSIRTYKKI